MKLSPGAFLVCFDAGQRVKRLSLVCIETASSSAQCCRLSMKLIHCAQHCVGFSNSGSRLLSAEITGVGVDRIKTSG